VCTDCFTNISSCIPQICLRTNWYFVKGWVILAPCLLTYARKYRHLMCRRSLSCIAHITRFFQVHSVIVVRSKPEIHIKIKTVSYNIVKEWMTSFDRLFVITMSPHSCSFCATTIDTRSLLRNSRRQPFSSVSSMPDRESSVLY
jgi:hypothetical protein